jgi:hypothetical protein
MTFVKTIELVYAPLTAGLHKIPTLAKVGDVHPYFTAGRESHSCPTMAITASVRLVTLKAFKIAAT